MNCKAGLTAKHSGILIMIGNELAMVDEHNECTENSKVIIVDFVVIMWANRIITRTIVQESAKIRHMHGTQLGIREGTGQDVVSKGWVMGSYKVSCNVSFIVGKQRQGRGNGFCM